MKDFSITSHIAYPEYRKMQFTLMYRKPRTKFWLAFGIFLLIGFIFSLLTYEGNFMESSISQFALLILVFSLYFFGFMYYYVRKTFRGNPRLQEVITYHFSEAEVASVGESFTSTFSWGKLHKVQTIPGWLLLYQQSILFNPIKLTAADKPHIAELKFFLQQNYPNVKLKIKD